MQLNPQGEVSSLCYPYLFLILSQYTRHILKNHEISESLKKLSALATDLLR